jgi:hypothetical protein
VGLVSVLQKISFISGIVLVAVPGVCSAHHYDKLTPGQKQLLQSGKQVTFFYDIPNEIWPKVRILQFVKATPEEAFAVIADFGRQAEYIHRVAASVPIPTNNPKVMWVDYRLKVPSILTAFIDPNYRMQEQIEYLGEERGYQICWSLLYSKSIRRVDGCSWFEPMPNGSTLVTYDTFITPISKNLIFRSKLALAAVRRGGGEALQTIVNRIEQEKIHNPALLNQEVLELRQRLDQSNSE